MTNELLAAGFDVKEENALSVPSASDEHYDLWEKGWKVFVETLTRTGKLKRLHLNMVYWASSTPGAEPLDWKFTPQHINDANKYLDKLYARVLQDLPDSQVLRFNRDIFLCDPSHLWGLSPFHCHKLYYQQALELLLKAAASLV